MTRKTSKQPPVPLKLTVTVERKHPSLPRFVVVPAAMIAPWGLRGTTIVMATLNGIEIGRRSLKRWDGERWFLDLPEPMCRRAQVDTGDKVVLGLRLASERLTAELTKALRDPATLRAWEALTPSGRRMLREHVLGAKLPSTRERRAARVAAAPGRPYITQARPTLKKNVRSVRVSGTSGAASSWKPRRCRCSRRRGG